MAGVHVAVLGLTPGVTYMTVIIFYFLSSEFVFILLDFMSVPVSSPCFVSRSCLRVMCYSE